MRRQSLLRRLIRKLDKTVAAWFQLDQWIILTGGALDYRHLDWNALSPLEPPKDRYWGDPFPWQQAGCRYAFIEEKLYGSGRGHIACLVLDPRGALLSQQVVLERSYHLSYPFVFERQGGLYMLPETAANRTVELYRCTRFPDRWELVRELLTDVYAVDATLLEHSGRWWLFANVKEAGGSSLNALHIYSSDDLLTGAWQPHPRNPVVLDLASARPAGRIFVQDGSLIRPAQDNSRRYGGALKFQRIETLSAGQYAERTVGSFTPARSRYRAVHTFNQAGDLTVVDAVLRRPK